jgi:hypothetical protein
VHGEGGMCGRSSRWIRCARWVAGRRRELGASEAVRSSRHVAGEAPVAGSGGGPNKADDELSRSSFSTPCCGRGPSRCGEHVCWDLLPVHSTRAVQNDCSLGAQPQTAAVVDVQGVGSGSASFEF